MNSPRSLEACRLLGIDPQSLYYVKFKKFAQSNPDIFRLNKESQQKRFENINKYRNEMIEAVKQKREEIIKEQEKGITSESNNYNSSAVKKKKKLDSLNLEKMLGDIREREEKNIEKIKQKQKNEIFGQIERNIKNKIIINKSNLKEQKVEKLHQRIKQQMQEKAEREDQMQKLCEEKRKKLYKEKLAKYEKDNAKKHEGELRQLEKIQKDNLLIQKEKEKAQKLMSEEYEKRLKLSKQRVKENRQKIIESIEKKKAYTQYLYNKLMEDREQKIIEQKNINKQKRIRMKEKLMEEKELREKINLKSQIRQEKCQDAANNMKLELANKIKKRAQSQSILFAENQERKEKMKEELQEKYTKLEKEMKEKEQKLEKEKEEKLYNIAMKQEDDYLKLYEKMQNINKIERINKYKSQKRNEEVLKKEKRMEEFKKKKNELIQSRSKQADLYEKEKEKLIVDFEKNFRNKEHFDTNQLIQNLFPTQDLSKNDTQLKLKIEKLIEEMNKTDPKNAINTNGVNGVNDSSKEN
jgi:hypothetical protein